MTQVSGKMTLGRLDRLPWISSYCAACIYQQNITVRLFSLLTYEEGNSAAMKHVKHISCVNKLVEAIHYDESMIYNLFAALVKLLKKKGKIW